MGLEYHSVTDDGRYLLDGLGVGSKNPIPTGVSDVTAAPLTFGGSPHVSKTLGSANVDSAFDAVVPAGTRYVEIYCAAACIVAIGEATSATLGRFVPGGLPAIFRLSDADVAAGKALHAQSATASAVVYAAYLAG